MAIVPNTPEPKEKDKDTGYMNVYIPRDEMNPRNTHVVGSINGVDYRYERGRVNKVKVPEGLEMLLTGVAVETK